MFSIVSVDKQQTAQCCRTNVLYGTVLVGGGGGVALCFVLWFFGFVSFLLNLSSLKGVVLHCLSFQTLFNPNKTVVKMFVVIYDLREMPANHQTFLRQRTFSVPVRREIKRTLNKENSHQTEERLLRYLIHLRWVLALSKRKETHRTSQPAFLCTDLLKKSSF